MGRTGKLKPDVALKEYWRQKEPFADLFNAVLFQGEERIRPEDLIDADTEVSTIIEQNTYLDSVEGGRDVMKVVKKSKRYGIELVLYGGIENQEKVHYAMPLRIGEYDIFSYKKQYLENAERYKERGDLSEEEFLSKMRKTDRLLPVVTIVIYYGEKPWDGAKSLHEMLKLPEEWKAFVNDYKMNLVEVNRDSLIFHHHQNQDLFQLCRILYDGSLSMKERKEKAVAYDEEHRTDEMVIRAVASATGYKTVLKRHRKETGNRMGTIWEEVERESRREGKREGKREGVKEGAARQIVEMGREFGLPDEEILQRLQVKVNLSLQEATRYLKKFGKVMV